MFCRTCKKALADHAVVCPGCGCKPRAGFAFCPACGADTPQGPHQAICTACGSSLKQDPLAALTGNQKSKLAAGLLNLTPLIGIPGGIGRLYTGHIGIGIAQLVLSFVCIGAIWSIIDGILILTSNDFRDADGNPVI